MLPASVVPGSVVVGWSVSPLVLLVFWLLVWVVVGWSVSSLVLLGCRASRGTVTCRWGRRRWLVGRVWVFQLPVSRMCVQMSVRASTARACAVRPSSGARDAWPRAVAQGGGAGVDGGDVLGGGEDPEAGHAVGFVVSGDPALVFLLGVSLVGAGGVSAQHAAPDGVPQFRHGLGWRGAEHVPFQEGGFLGVQVFGVQADGGGLDGGDPSAVQRGERVGQSVHEVGGLVQVHVGGGFGDPEREGDLGGQEFPQSGVGAGQFGQVRGLPGLEVGDESLPGLQGVD